MFGNEISVCDALTGTGKTSAAINYMNRSLDRNFIFITPYLEECSRIVRSCPGKIFKCPSEKPSKLESLHALLRGRQSISSTHALFSTYTPETAKLIKDGHYTLIMDEAFNVVGEVSMTGGNMKELFKSGKIEVDDETHRVKWLDKEYEGTTYIKFKLRADAGTLMHYKGKFLFWLFPPDVFNAFDEVIVLTYMFEAQEQRCYFDINNIGYNYIGVSKGDGGEYEFVRGDCRSDKHPWVKDKISILYDEKFNGVGNRRTAFSSSWSSEFFSDPYNANMMANKLRNLLEHTFRSKGKDVMWTTFKPYSVVMDKLRYKSGFVNCASRATNSHRGRDKLAYCVNMYMNPFRKSYFMDRGCRIDEDAYALSAMIQWIWRSAIRDGKPIRIYVPSSRMRGLLEKWIDEVSGCKPNG
jgi:hypothetical protein